MKRETIHAKKYIYEVLLELRNLIVLELRNLIVSKLI